MTLVDAPEKQRRPGAMSPRRYALFMAAAAALIFLASNVLVDHVLRGARLDLTDHRLYSLSPGTKQIVGDLAEPIDLTIYYSAEASAKYPVLRTYSARVREMLQSYAARAHGRIRLREVNPARYSEAEDEAVAAGVQSLALEQGGDPVFFGLAGANAVDERVAISFLSPDREPYLEYEITRLISELETPRSVKVGVITSLPLDPYAAADPQGAESQPMFFAELARAMKVEMLQRGFTQIPSDVEELVILQPWAMSPGEFYAIDQFIMAKGRAFIAVDPAALSWAGGGSPFAPVSVEPSSDMNALFAAWGVNVSDDVVLDGQGALEVQTSDASGRPIIAPQPLYVNVPAKPEQLSPEDLVTAGLNRGVYFAGAGAITWATTDGVIITPLARTSNVTRRLTAGEALMGASPLSILPRFMDGQKGKVETFSIRVAGSLKSAFGATAPVAIAGAGQARHLAKSARPAEIVIVSDVDFLNDPFYVGQNRTPFVDNAAFALNAIDLLAGSDALVSLRSRAKSARMLETVEDMRRSAQARLLQTEQKLSNELAQTEARLSELESKGAGSGFFTGDLGAELTVDERGEVERFRAQSLRLRTELRGVQRDYRRDIDRLEGWLMALNVWAAPVLVAAAGIFLFWRRTRRSLKIRP